MDHGASSYRRFLNGDEDAFRQIVADYFDKLVFFVNRYVHDYAAAEDIALDAFARLVADKKHYNFRVSLKTYLFMLGRSRALDYIKHRNKLSMVELSEAAELADEGPSPEELVLADEQKRALNKALEALSPEQRLAIHLVYFEQLSADEAAKVLKSTRKRVYNLLYLAKNALRRILDKEDMLF